MIPMMIPEETVRAAWHERNREVARLMAVNEARKADSAPTRQEHDGWMWTVEREMGEAFESLRGWLLSGMSATRRPLRSR